jgi:hypothetical protein
LIYIKCKVTHPREFKWVSCAQENDGDYNATHPHIYAVAMIFVFVGFSCNMWLSGGRIAGAS